MSKYWVKLDECDYTGEYLEGRPAHQKFIQGVGSLLAMAALYPIVKVANAIEDHRRKQGNLEKVDGIK